MNRREALRRGSRLAAGIALGGLAARAAAEPARKSGFRIGACDWSLRRGDPSVFEVAAEIGLDGVQVNMGGRSNGMHARRPEVQRAYREAAEKRGLEIASLALGELNNVPLASDPVAAIWLLDSLDVARALGVKVILMAFFGRGEVKPEDGDAMARLVGVLKEVAPRAEQAGLILGLENYLSAEDNLRIIDKVGSPALQVYYDVGNSTDKGHDILAEIRRLKGLICEFHAKDGPHLLGKGRIDFRKVRQAMDDIGYGGWIHIEAAAPSGVVADYRENLAYLREIFPREA